MVKVAGVALAVVLRSSVSMSTWLSLLLPRGAMLSDHRISNLQTHTHLQTQVSGWNLTAPVDFGRSDSSVSEPFHLLDARIRNLEELVLFAC